MSQLVDLHGQHEHQALLDPDVHLDLLDQFAGLDGERAARSRRRYADWTALRRRPRRAAQARERDKDARAEFLRFQLGEIDRVAPRAGEDEELAADAAAAGQRREACDACATRRTRGCTTTTRRC